MARRKQISLSISLQQAKFIISCFHVCIKIKFCSSVNLSQNGLAKFIWFLTFCYLCLKSFEELYRHYSSPDFRGAVKSHEAVSMKSSLSLEKAHSKNKGHITQFSEVTSLGQQQVSGIPVSLTLGCIKRGNAALRTDNFPFPGTKAPTTTVKSVKGRQLCKPTNNLETSSTWPYLTNI